MVRMSRSLSWRRSRRPAPAVSGECRCYGSVHDDGVGGRGYLRFLQGAAEGAVSSLDSMGRSPGNTWSWASPCPSGIAAAVSARLNRPVTATRMVSLPGPGQDEGGLRASPWGSVPRLTQDSPNLPAIKPFVQGSG